MDRESGLINGNKLFKREISTIIIKSRLKILSLQNIYHLEVRQTLQRKQRGDKAKTNIRMVDF